MSAPLPEPCLPWEEGRPGSWCSVVRGLLRMGERKGSLSLLLFSAAICSVLGAKQGGTGTESALITGCKTQGFRLEARRITAVSDYSFPLASWPPLKHSAALHPAKPSSALTKPSPAASRAAHILSSPPPSSALMVSEIRDHTPSAESRLLIHLSTGVGVKDEIL